MRRHRPRGPLGFEGRPPAVTADHFEPLRPPAEELADLAAATDGISGELYRLADQVIDAARGVKRSVENDLTDQVKESISAAGMFSERLGDEAKAIMRGRFQEPVAVCRRLGGQFICPHERTMPDEEQQGTYPDDAASQGTVAQPAPTAPPQTQGQITVFQPVLPTGQGQVMPFPVPVTPAGQFPPFPARTVPTPPAIPPATIPGQRPPRPVRQPPSGTPRTAPAGPGQVPMVPVSPTQPTAPGTPISTPSVPVYTNGTQRSDGEGFAGCCGVRFTLHSDDSWDAEIPLEMAPELAALLPGLDRLIDQTYQEAIPDALTDQDDTGQVSVSKDEWS